MPSLTSSIAIIGRPNVGKSTLFNRIIGQRRSIVTDEPGITRDRIYGTATWDGRSFEIVDTGGIVPGEQSEMPVQIFRQAQVAIEAASLVILSLIHISEPTRLLSISYAVFCLKKKKKN